MKKVLSMILVGTLLLICASCGQKDSVATWQEQYDLGIRYLSEGNYEEAIIAFTAAIEIDPKQASSYIARGDAYLANGDLDLAENDYNAAQKLAPEIDIQERFDSIEQARQATELEDLKAELQPILEQLDIPFTVDNIELGITSIEIAKATYIDRPYAMSNLMNDDTEDTVYVCFGMDTPIPEGYMENEFGFLFAAPVGGAVSDIIINDASFTCLDEIRVGAGSDSALSYFGFPTPAPIGALEWTLAQDRSLVYSGQSADTFRFLYKEGTNTVLIDVVEGIIHTICLNTD